MSIRILQYDLDDLVVDYEAVTASLNQACRRRPGYRVEGLCQTDSSVVLALDPGALEAPGQYVIAPFTGFSAAQIVADIHARYQGKFATRGLIRLPGLLLGLFEKQTPGARADSPRDPS